MLTARRLIQGLCLLAAFADASAQQIVLGDTLFFPEGLDVDARNRSVIVTSMAYGQVVRFNSSGEAERIFPQGSPLPAAVFGVAVDTICECLWLTTAPHIRRTAVKATGLTALRHVGTSQTESRERAASLAKADTHSHSSADSVHSAASLVLVRLSSGEVIKRWTLGDGSGMPGEIALTPEGDVVVSDGIRGSLYMLRRGNDTLETIHSPMLRSPQGIAVSAGGNKAYIADWSRGLIRWDIASGSFDRLLMPDGALLRGVDGLRAHGDWLIGVQNGVAPARVIAIRPDSAGTSVAELRILDSLSDWNGEPTVGAVVGSDYIFVATSQWPFWDDTGVRRGSTALPAVVLRRVAIGQLNR